MLIRLIPPFLLFEQKNTSGIFKNMLLTNLFIFLTTLYSGTRRLPREAQGKFPSKKNPKLKYFGIKPVFV